MVMVEKEQHLKMRMEHIRFGKELERRGSLPFTFRPNTSRRNSKTTITSISSIRGWDSIKEHFVFGSTIAPWARRWNTAASN
jgi:hypothetical protein